MLAEATANRAPTEVTFMATGYSHLDTTQRVAERIPDNVDLDKSLKALADESTKATDQKKP